MKVVLLTRECEWAGREEWSKEALGRGAEKVMLPKVYLGMLFWLRQLTCCELWS